MLRNEERKPRDLLKPPVKPIVLEQIAEANALALRFTATTFAYKLAARTWGAIDSDNVVALIYSAVCEELGAREAQCKAEGGHQFFEMDGGLRCGMCAVTYTESQRPIYGLQS